MALIDCLIFSKDRPAQLDLLLRSIQQNAPNLYRTVTVLHTWSDPSFAGGYGVCMKEHRGLRRGLRFEFEYFFQGAVYNWIKDAGEIVSFLCDDDVFYRDAQEPEELPWSYRGGDYDYPFSLDGNVYAKADIAKLLRGLRFGNPTELEHQGHLHRDRLPFTEVAHGTPCLVGIPANRVSVSSRMPHMGQHEYDLNEQYLAGRRLRLDLVESVIGRFENERKRVPAHTNLKLLFDEAATDVGQAATTQGWLL